MTASAPGGSAPDTVTARVARQLSHLGRDSSLLSEGALDALRRECGHSEDRLRTVLKCALFLASTEDASELDAGHVERAAAMQPATGPVRTAKPAPPVRMRKRPVLGAMPGHRLLPPDHQERAARRSGGVILGVAAAAMVGAALLFPRSISELPTAPREPVSARPILRSPAPSTMAKVMRVAPAPVMAHPDHQEPPVAASRASAASPPARAPAPVLAAPALEPMPPPRIVSVAPAFTALPSGAVPRVAIEYERRDPAAQRRAEALADSLREQAVQVLWLTPARRRVAASVLYYYAEDRAGAERIGEMLGPEWRGRALPAHPSRAALAWPGTIRVFVR